MIHVLFFELFQISSSCRLIVHVNGISKLFKCPHCFGNFLIFGLLVLV